MSTRAFAAALIAGFALRVLLLVSSVGTNDAEYVTRWGYAAAKNGIAASYRLSPLINHPPLSLTLMAAASKLADATKLQTYQTFRAFQVLADAVTATMLFLLGRRLQRGAELAVLFLLTPAVMFISAFHCNSDATMVAFLVAAVYFMATDRPMWSGAFLAASINIKIVPLLLVPMFIVAAGRRRAQFLAALAAILAAGFVPAVVSGGPVVLTNIFLYAGFQSGEWGVPAVLRLAGATLPPLAPFASAVIPSYMQYGQWIAALAVFAVAAFKWRRGMRPEELGGAVSLCLMILLVLTPGFGVQYLLWPLPMLPLLIRRRWYIVVAGVVSAFLFYTYTVWSGGLPWWYAESRNHYPGTVEYVLFGIVVWIALTAAAAYGLRRFLSAKEPYAEVP
jgi:hypothetical protein